MDSYGLDVARGGGDNTIDFRVTVIGTTTRTYLKAKTHQMTNKRIVCCLTCSRPCAHSCRCHWRWCKYIRFLKAIRYSRCTCGRTQCCNCIRPFRQLSFYNLRSQLWWQFREALDPAYGSTVLCRLNQKLLADLTAPRWGLQEPKSKWNLERKLLSVLAAVPTMLCNYHAQIDTPKRHIMQTINASAARRDYDPYA